MENKGKWAAPVIACAIIIALMAYVGCYFLLSTQEHGFYGGTGGNDLTRPTLQRRFEYRWVADLFGPLTVIETLVTGADTSAVARDY